MTLKLRVLNFRHRSIHTSQKYRIFKIKLCFCGIVYDFFGLFFFPFAKHCGPFTKLSLNIQKNMKFFCVELEKRARESCSNLSMYHINNIAHKSSVFIFCKRSLTVKIHNQYLFIGFVLRISAHDRVITHKNKKNILRKADERAIQMKGTLTIALFIILTANLPLLLFKIIS